MAAAVQAPISHTQLIFPESSNNFSRTLQSIKRSRLSIRNRLASILEDAKFAQRVSVANKLPLVANERCGSWYIPTQRKAGSVYFKSTDGHQSEWKFSTRRLNMDLPALLGKYGGAVIVDSTRRGKSMPDALSKTIPIWCAVMNYFLFPDKPESHELVVDPSQVSASEAAQIRAKLDDFRMDLAILGLSYEKHAAACKKPMRPYFVTQESDVIKVEVDDAYQPIICCSVSRREKGDNDTYVQGAGDDNENWSCGLTAELYWEYRQLLSHELDDATLEDRINKIVRQRKAAPKPSAVHKIDVGANMEPLYVCDLATLKTLPAMKEDAEWEQRPYDLLVTCGLAKDEEDESGSDEPVPSFRHLARYSVHLRCNAGKLGSRALRKELQRMVNSMINIVGIDRSKMLFACENGKDLSIGTALVASVMFYSHARERQNAVDKHFIRTRLAMITSQYPQANPSRATLTSVNAFLMQENNGFPSR